MNDVRRITRSAGQAGHVEYHVEVATDAGALRRFTFRGNIFVGPVAVVSTTEDGRREAELVCEPRRFGEFASPDWIRRFLASRQDTASATAPATHRGPAL